MNNEPTDSPRLFYALWPDGATRAALTQLQIAMEGRLTRSDNFHLTLAFLGEQPASSLPLLTAILSRLPSSLMRLTIDRIGYFTEPHIAWAGMSSAPDALSLLKSALMLELDREHLAIKPKDEFIPHITLARNTTVLEDFPFDAIPWMANQIALVQSVPDREGVHYRVLASRMLDGH